MLSLAACFHFFAFLSCGTLFLLLHSYKILLEIFSSLFFLPMFLPNCPKSHPTEGESGTDKVILSLSSCPSYSLSTLQNDAKGGDARGLWPCTIGVAGPLLSLLWDTRPQDLSLLCLKRRGVRRCTSQCLCQPTGHLSKPLT